MKIVDKTVTANYTMIRVANLSIGLDRDIELWMLQTQCGKRVAWNRFAFKTDEEFTMFTLRWSQELNT